MEQTTEMNEPSAPVIRRVEDDDGLAAANVWLAARHASYPAIPAPIHTDDEVRSWFSEVLIPKGEVWVVVESAAVQAVMVLDNGWIDQLYVAPTATGKGFGARLLALAKDRSPGGLQLWTFESNLGARRFYERHGFLPIERTDGTRNEHGWPDIRYSGRQPLLRQSSIQRWQSHGQTDGQRGTLWGGGLEVTVQPSAMGSPAHRRDREWNPNPQRANHCAIGRERRQRRGADKRPLGPDDSLFKRQNPVPYYSPGPAPATDEQHRPGPPQAAHCGGDHGEGRRNNGRPRPGPTSGPLATQEPKDGQEPCPYGQGPAPMPRLFRARYRRHDDAKLRSPDVTSAPGCRLPR